MIARRLLGGLLAGTLLLAATASAWAQQFVTVLTGGTAGVYYPLGVALSKIYGDKISSVRTSVQSTKASVENLNLLQAGKGEIAFTLGDSLIAAWKGDAEAGFKAPLDKLRGIAGIYPNYVQIVASKESGIRTLADLKGKRLSVGAPRSGTELNARAILAAAGLSYADLGKVEYLPFAESVELMKNRQLDATLQSAGLGVASIRDLATAIAIQMVPVSPEIVARIGDPFRPGTIPAGTYTGQDADVPTATIPNFLVTHTGVPDDLAYAMTRELFENLDQLAAAHAEGRKIRLEAALEGMPVPLHPGAERFYRERGLIR
ncbi:MAG: TAXI family TRAP transporter solute-binding subunit [Geminicoccaceae bacterium]|nr:TAXI family TRAP transporter solute-binding subunit [Geminicoccaceae bacterium]MDW8368844.1 TAXI family TRAP transporter solute-binding subunit [Geminicoccaceae bacterium]